MTALIPTAGLLYPFGLGLLAAVNPCGFPLLPVYLDFFVGRADGSTRSRRVERAVVAGGCATLGFVVLFGGLGLLAELGVSTLTQRAPTIAALAMVVVGVAMASLGVATVAHRALRLRLPALRSGLGLRRPLALMVFGLSYGLASVGCAFPLFLAAVGGSFTRTGLVSAVGSFVAYALGMGTLLAATALVVALVGPSATRSLRRFSRFVPYAGGALLVAVGSYLTLYWVTDLVSPTVSSWPERVVTSVQSQVSSYVGDHVAVLGAVLGGVVVAALVAGSLGAGALSGRTPTRDAATQEPAAVAGGEPDRVAARLGQ